MEKVFVKIKRQDHPDQSPYWEEFLVPFEKGQTVDQILAAIRMNPVNAEGKGVPPVVWDACCGQGQCGSCLMLINGKAKLACQTQVEKMGKSFRLEPLSAFPILRDLAVDKSQLEASYVAVQDHRLFDGFDADAPPPSLDACEARHITELFSCLNCGACLEACPNSDNSNYLGAPAFVRARAFNLLSQKQLTRERLKTLMDVGGVEDCGNNQQCQSACPADVPILASIAQLKRAVTVEAFRLFFGG